MRALPSPAKVATASPLPLSGFCRILARWRPPGGRQRVPEAAVRRRPGAVRLGPDEAMVWSVSRGVVYCSRSEGDKRIPPCRTLSPRLGSLPGGLRQRAEAVPYLDHEKHDQGKARATRGPL